MRTGPLRIRGALAKDAGQVAVLLSELGFPTSRRAVLARLPKLRGAAFVAVERGVIVGVVTTNIMPVLHRTTPVGRISALVVTEAARNLGVGRALVQAAEAKLRRKGCGLVEVTSNVRLRRAHRFYEHLGYEKTSVRFKRDVL